MFTIALHYKKSHASRSDHLNLRYTTFALYLGDRFTISKMSSLACIIWAYDWALYYLFLFYLHF